MAKAVECMGVGNKTETPISQLRLRVQFQCSFYFPFANKMISEYRLWSKKSVDGEVKEGFNKEVRSLSAD